MTEQVVAAFVKEPLSEAALDQLEEHLLESDLGPAATDRIVARFRELRFGAGANEREVKEALAEAVAAELVNHEARYEPLDGPRRSSPCSWASTARARPRPWARSPPT
jgi:fused signal recognition particle receptor